MKTPGAKESEINFAVTVTQSPRSTAHKRAGLRKAARPSWWESLPLSKSVLTARASRRAT